MIGQLQETARQLGLPFGNRSHTYNSRLAQELGLWAQHGGHGREFHQAAFHGYFVDGSNLADQQVLLQLAERAGLAAAEAKKVLEDRSWRGAVDRDWQESRQLGITAVPTMVLGNSRLVGAQSYPVLAELMYDHHIPRRQ